MTDAAVAFAALLTAVGTLLTAIVAAIVAVRSLKRTEKRVEATEQIALRIDHAVNGVEPGEQSIGENVQDIHDALPDTPIAPLVRKMAQRLVGDD